ncbi:MAG: 50S ribosomal protein L23 [Pseudomonadota bacterium]
MNLETIMNVLLAPHISEKQTIAQETRNEYVFRVRTDATKQQIKKAVESLFEVEVLRVTTLNVKGKTKRTGMVVGKRKNWKKAYVTLKEGQSIDLFGGE